MNNGHRDLAFSHRRKEKVCNSVMLFTVPCIRKSYKVLVAKVDYNSGAIKVEALSNTPGRPLFYFYSTADVMRQKEMLLMTLSDLLNALGGNLGLFLGFSCISILSTLLERCRRCCAKKN